MKHVRTAAIAGFDKTVTDLGGDFKHICALSSVPSDSFSPKDYDKYITLDKVALLMRNAATVTNCYHIGLLLGLNKKASALGIVGLIVRDTANVKSAMEALINNLHIHAQDSIAASFRFNKKEAILSIDPVFISGKTNHHLADLIVGCSIGLLKSLCGEAFKLNTIKLSERDRDSLTQYKRLLKTEVEINHLHNEIIFPRALLDIELEGIDPQYNALIKDYVAKSDEITNYSRRVKNIIRNMLSNSKCNIDYISSQFNFNKRTLNRKLAMEGTSFKYLLIEIKKEEAQKLLANSHISITDVAMELGYAESTSFTNAFKRWFGISPTKWQQQNGNNNNIVRQYSVLK